MIELQNYGQFPEESLDEVKEHLCKRLNLSSVSDFALFYDTDIALVNDDDFAAFESHASTTVAKPPAKSSDSVALPGETSAPRKKRKVTAPALDLESISSAPRKQPRSVALVERETVSTAPASEPVEAPGAKPKKKSERSDATAHSAPPNLTVSTTAPAPVEQPDPLLERPQKKSKKVAEKDAGTAPKSSASVPDGAPDNTEPHIGAGNRRKGKSKSVSENGLDRTPPKSSKKPTKKSKKDAQAEDVPGTVDRAEAKSAFPDQSANTTLVTSGDGAAESESVSTKQRRPNNESDADSLSGEQAKKTSKARKKNVEQSTKDVGTDQAQPSLDLAAVAEFVKGLVATKVPALEADDGGHKASSSRRSKKTAPVGNDIACPVCRIPPLHLRYRCPIVLAGSASIRKRIAELQQDDATHHLQLIQELRNLAEKSEKSSKPKDLSNVNAHSTVPRALEQTGGVSNSSAGHKLVPSGDGSDSSSDDSDIPPLAARKIIPPRPLDLHTDAELDAIIRGPLTSRLTVNDIMSEEEQEDGTESVVLENDDEDDIKFRRRSRKLDVAGSSGEEDEDDDDNFDANADAQLPVVNLSVRTDSRRSSTRSATEPLDTFMAIDARQSMDIDSTGNKAVDDAMASDQLVFNSDSPVVANVTESTDILLGSPQSTRTTPIPLPLKGPPKCATEDTILAGDDDPIQPAEGFPPTPIQQNKTAQLGIPSTPRVSQRMKDQNGKTPMRLSQLDPPFNLSSQTQTKAAESTQPGEDTNSRRIRTRSATRVGSLAVIPPSAPMEVQPPAKKRRAPNKTAEQRAQEEAAKLAAKEAKASLKAQAKGAKKGKTLVENGPTTDPSVPEVAAPKLPSDSAPPVGTPHTSIPPPRTPVSQAEWTVLKSTSPVEDEYREHDELRSSSPQPPIDGDHGEAPLFFPAESQVPFPYSQWNSVPEDACPGSPKESEDEDEEEEVAASMKPSQRPTGSYRRLTDIASQPSLFSTKPTLRAADLPSASFPRSKDKRDELYGALTREDDDSTDSDSSTGEAPSHIPKSRRAGVATR
ncbi:hypothetical protein B0H11DRAFT_2227147 [Mycena galericulata]|nr:hypothetical protein B0H11DRAFT_2227147 [Mycena galericulata]